MWKYSKEADTSYRELVDLSVLKGEDGKSSTVTIGENGNWFIDGVDTEIRARANDGKGITGVSKTSSEGLVDTYTITFTDDTTAIFTVTNGADGQTGSAGATGATGNGISSIAKGNSEGLIDTYIITFTDGTTTTFAVTNGKDGANGSDGAAGNGITSIVKGDTVGLVDSYIINFSNGTTFTFTVTNGADGNDGSAGAAGNGISSVDKIGTEGLVDTYKITFTDGTSTTFTITNGAAGNDGAAGATGNGIASIVKTNTEGLVDTYTITFTDSTTTTFTVTNGSQGSQGIQGETGNGILSVAKTGTEGLVDTYTITFTDGTTTTFTVTNGQDATADDTIVEYTNNGLGKTIYEYKEDGSVEKVTYIYRNSEWQPMSKFVTSYRDDAYADPNTPYEQTIEYEYKWNASTEAWEGVVATGYEYRIEGHTLKSKWTFDWSDEFGDFDYRLFHIMDYDIYGNKTRDYYFKQSESGAYYKYGTEIVTYDELHSYTEVHYTWAGNTGIFYATAKAHAVIYFQGKPFYETTIHLRSNNGYVFETQSSYSRKVDEFGDPIEDGTNYFSSLTDSDGTVYPWYYSYNDISDGETYYEQNYIQYVFSNVYMAVIPHSAGYSQELKSRSMIILQNIYKDYDITKYDYIVLQTQEVQFTQDGSNIPVQRDDHTYINGVEQPDSRGLRVYNCNSLGQIETSYIFFGWIEEEDNWEKAEKEEITYDEYGHVTFVMGYLYDFDTEEWNDEYKVIQEWDGANPDPTRVIVYEWDPTLNEGEGDWVVTYDSAEF